MWEGSAPDGPTDVSVAIPAVGAGLDDGGLETRHAGSLAGIAHDATDDEDAGGKERSHVDFIAEIRELPVENERLSCASEKRDSRRGLEHMIARAMER